MSRQQDAKKAADPSRFAVKVGNVSVPIYAMPYVRKNGSVGQQYCVTFYEAGRRMRRNFVALSDARGVAEKQARAIERGEREGLRITGDDARTFDLARTSLTGTSLTIVEVCRQYVAATKRLPHGVTLIQAVEEFASRVSTVKHKTVTEAALEFITKR